MLKLKLIRFLEGHTQWDLCRATGISQGRLSMIERGLIEATQDEQERLAKALKAPSATLFRAVTFLPNKTGLSI